VGGLAEKAWAAFPVEAQAACCFVGSPGSYGTLVDSNPQLAGSGAKRGTNDVAPVEFDELRVNALQSCGAHLG